MCKYFSLLFKKKKKMHFFSKNNEQPTHLWPENWARELVTPGTEVSF